MWKYLLISTILWSAMQCKASPPQNRNNVTNIASIASIAGYRNRTFAGILSKKIPDGYIPRSEFGSAYKLNVWSLPWNKARQICYSEGAQLAIINSITERNWLYDLLELRGIQYAWLGVHDLYEKDDWVTVTGIPLAATGFSTWMPGEPNNSGGNERCVELWNQNTRGMNDKNCAQARAFICEAPIS